MLISKLGKGITGAVDKLKNSKVGKLLQPGGLKNLGNQLKGKLLGKLQGSKLGQGLSKLAGGKLGKTVSGLMQPGGLKNMAKKIGGKIGGKVLDFAGKTGIGKKVAGILGKGSLKNAFSGGIGGVAKGLVDHALNKWQPKSKIGKLAKKGLGFAANIGQSIATKGVYGAVRPVFRCS